MSKVKSEDEKALLLKEQLYQELEEFGVYNIEVKQDQYKISREEGLIAMAETVKRTKEEYEVMDLVRDLMKRGDQ